MLCSEHPTGPTTLTTIAPSATGENDAERKARHLATLKRLADLGLDLAERAAVEAKREPLAPTPQTPGQPARQSTDARLVFARLSRDVRETMALEARIAAGKLPAAPRQETEPRADPRRPAILKWLHTEIAATPRPKPERNALERHVETRVTEHLNEDQGLTLPGGAIIHAICEEFGLTFNPRTMDDDLLLRPGQPFPTYHPNDEADDAYDEDDDEAEFSLSGPDPP